MEERHKAVDGLTMLFKKANHDLNLVQHKLDREFPHIYPDNVNPMKLVSRIKRIQEQLSSLREDCRELLAAKQNLIDEARTIIVGNRNSVQQMQVSMGMPPDGNSDDSAFDNFNQVIKEWTEQIRSRQANDADGSDSEDINSLLFSSIV